MWEMPEAATLARQMNATLTGKVFHGFSQGELRHKFLWLDRPVDESSVILAGQAVTGASTYGRSIYLHVGVEHLLWFGEIGGRLLYHPTAGPLPSKYHLLWDFRDGTALSFTLQMWGFVRLLERSDFTARPHKETGIPPLSPDLTFERFNDLLEAYPEKTGKGVKGFLVTSQHINGIGNSYAQDILFRARLSPKRKIPDISAGERRQLFDAIQETMAQAIALDGRQDEHDLFNQPGRYVRLMSSQTAGTPCPSCGTPIEKIAYLGGACYLCPRCQSTA
jgi:formamidopyrimidine-DNA glycosylase